tara:strand:+ start:253 stop:519 length:267 start_codon:yes stop_codon:yes gene_type:complete
MILQKITKQSVKYSELESEDQTIVDKEINRIDSMIRLLEREQKQYTYSFDTTYNLDRLSNYLYHVKDDIYKSLNIQKYNQLLSESESI